MTLDLIDFLMKFSFSLFLSFYLQVSFKNQHHFICMCRCVAITDKFSSMFSNSNGIRTNGFFSYSSPVKRKGPAVLTLVN